MPDDFGDDVVLSGGSAFVLSDDLGLCALDAADGSLQWHQSLARVSPSSPAVADDLVVVSTPTIGDADSEHEGEARAYDTAEGTEQWNRADVTPSSTQPTVFGEHVYLSGDFDAESIESIDVASGETEWTVDLDGEPGQPAVSDDGVFVATSTSLYRLDGRDGSTIWRQPAGGRGAVPTVVEGTLYAQIDGETLAALDVENGEQNWSHRGASESTFSVGVDSGIVYAASDRAVVALDEDGSTVWRRQAGEIAGAVDNDSGDSADFGELGLTDDAIYVGFGRGIVALERNDGSVLWHEQFRNRLEGDADMGGSPGAPAIGDDTVYAFTIGGDLYAVAR